MGPPAALAYPWFAEVSGDQLEQGDIFASCPVFIPPDDIADTKSKNAQFRCEERDVIVLSQSCDLVKGREKLDEVLLCAVWKPSEIKEGALAKAAGLEQVRKGMMPGFHLLAECPLTNHRCEARVVDFRRVYSLPVSFVRKLAGSRPRIRLLPPYREHLSQAFARYFMRVGLPIDIPPFTEKKE